jgi:hypothetical protein
MTASRTVGHASQVGCKELDERKRRKRWVCAEAYFQQTLEFF